MKTFRQALSSALEGGDQSLKSLCEKAGVSYEQMKKVLQRDNARTNVDDAVKIAAALGLTLDEFLQDNLASDRIEIAKIYSSLSQQEVQLLRDLAKSRDDLPD